MCLVNSALPEFTNTVKENEDSEFIISPSLFEVKKKIALLQIRFV